MLVISVLLAGTFATAPYPSGKSCASEFGESPNLVLLDQKPTAGAAFFGSPGWLEINDTGVATDARSSSPVAEFVVPLRFGTHLIDAQPGDNHFELVRKQASATPGHVEIRVLCANSPGDAARAAWLKRVAAVAADLTGRVPPERLSALLRDIDALRTPDAPREAAALTAHLRAQAYVKAERFGESQGAFVDAEREWDAIGEHDKAVVARAGRIEDLNSLARYQEILDLVPEREIDGEAWKQRYFRIRLRNARCVAFDNLGRLAEAAACYAQVAPALKALDERTEYASVTRNQAVVLQSLGRSDDAEALARSVLTIPSGPGAAMARGRLQFTLADIALSRGRIAAALAACRQALTEFVAAESPRWQANVLLRLSRVYRDIGADDEAYLALEQALKQFSRTDAPARVTETMALFAELEERHGWLDAAGFWADAATRAFQAYGMRDQADAARLQRASVAWRHHDDETAAALAAPSVGTAANAAARDFVDAAVALDRRQFDEAARLIATLDARPLALGDRIRLTLLRADLQARQGHADAARSSLTATARNIDGIAAESRSETLRYALLRQIAPLRRAALRQIMAQTGRSDADKAADAWPWLERDVEVASHERSEGKGDFDAALSSELLATPTHRSDLAATAAQRALLEVLDGSRPVNAASAPDAVQELTAMRDGLGDGAAIIVLLDTGDQIVRLWMTSASVTVTPLGNTDAVDVAIGRLRDDVSSAATSVAVIHDDAAALSTLVFGGLPTGAAPRRLRVIADERSLRVPWAVLQWPSTSQMLIDDSAVSVERLGVRSASTPTGGAPTVHALVASLSHVGASPLPALATAAVEAQLVQTGVGSRLQVTEAAATPTRFLAALGEAGAWVHVAAHGSAQPQRLGYAGLWLEPDAADSTPVFESWLDVLEHGVRANLVVLDACQLADSGRAIDGNLSFAAAVSRAGARQVVASMWPVSDAAAGIWVPAFYDAISSDPAHDAAAALRTAQLRLRDTRAFRHPFYWAGFQVLSR